MPLFLFRGLCLWGFLSAVVFCCCLFCSWVFFLFLGLVFLVLRLFSMKVAIMLVTVIILFCTTTLISAFVFRDHHHRKLFEGTVTLVAAVMMYASPLEVVRQVIRTKSVEFMPFYLSLFSFLSSLLWMIYGLLSHDLFIASANIASTPLGLLQLIINFIYRKRGNKEEPNKWDIEQNEEKSVSDIDQSTAVTDGD